MPDDDRSVRVSDVRRYAFILRGSKISREGPGGLVIERPCRHREIFRDCNIWH